MAKYRVLKQPHEQYFPVGTLVERVQAPATPNSRLAVYSDGKMTRALYPEEVEPVAAEVPAKQPRDVSVEAVGVKATFTGAEAKIGAWATAIVLVVLAAAYLVAGCASTTIVNHGTVTIQGSK